MEIPSEITLAGLARFLGVSRAAIQQVPARWSPSAPAERAARLRGSSARDLRSSAQGPGAAEWAKLIAEQRRKLLTSEAMSAGAA
jgi:hypothetical protein